jgi:hypothetical protein
MAVGTVAELPATPPAQDLFGPFDHDDFRADLATLSSSVRDGWQRWAAECIVIARLAVQIPRTPFDTRGATPWTSFLREIAVARRCSDQAAASEFKVAVALVAAHPRTLSLLQAGVMPQFHARVLVEESLGLEPAAVAAVEAEVAERACRLSPSRVRDAVLKIELRYDADAAAARAAKAARGRDVRLVPQADAQAALLLSGPALALVQIYERLSAEARAAKAAGDPRGVDELRFDLATGRLLADDADDAEDVMAAGADEPTAPAVPGAPAMKEDRRCSRPIRANIHLPITTALGLDNEPGWLDGYGWISAPQCREWLAVAELRQVCVNGTGQVVDVADRIVRPEPTPTGIRGALLAMVERPGGITPKTYESQPQHDPSRRLAEFVDIRDIVCDGPTGRRVRADRCDHDHEIPYPDGPTAAWNIVARARRTHGLKHDGWSPFRTGNSTLWFTPSGQIVEVEHTHRPPPELDADAVLPDPDELHEIDAELIRVTGPDEDHPLSEPPPPF